MKKLLLGSVLALVAVSANAIVVDSDYTCMQMFYDHGLTTTAANKCKLKYVNSDIKPQTQKCFALARQTGQQAELRNALANGVKTFAEAYTNNKKLSCERALLDFPDYLDK